MSQGSGKQTTFFKLGGGLPAGFDLLPDYLKAPEAYELMADLLETANLDTHLIRIFGRTCPMPRRIAWFGDQSYSYSGVQHPARPLPGNIQRLAQQLENDLEQPFNGVLLNHYRTGEDSMGWHTDDDYDAGEYPKIASISLGATRRFRLRPKSDPSLSMSVDLDHGSLLVMGAGTQLTHQHALPKMRKALGGRLNLTFRWMEPK